MKSEQEILDLMARRVELMRDTAVSYANCVLNECPNDASLFLACYSRHCGAVAAFREVLE